jgi:hypothetical protein
VRQEELGEEIFVPRIMFLMIEGEARSVAVWPDGLPILLPQVDLLLVPRRMSKPELPDAVVPWSAIVEFVQAYPALHAPLTHYKLDYEDPPEELVDFLAKLPACHIPLDEVGLTMDRILDEELMAGGDQS